MTKVLFKRKNSDEIANLPVEDGALIYNYETGATYLDYDDERIATGGGMPTGDTFPIGAISPYAGSIAPTNWLICDGSAISRVTYADLFSVIGTTYGAGDGSTTFNLPDLQGKIPVGKDTTQNEFDTLGETGGEKAHTLTVEEMPAHKHLFKFTKEIADPVTGSGEIFFGSTRAWNMGDNRNITEESGGGAAHNILQPYITLNYIIKAFQSSGTDANVSTTTTTSDTDTYSCNYINECNTYSTDETLTGETWIDGKPIYRKVIEYTGEIQASTWTPISISSLGISYVDNLAIKGGYLKYPENITESIYSNNNRVQFLNYSNNISFYFPVSPSKVTLIVEYTKTTD